MSRIPYLAPEAMTEPQLRRSRELEALRGGKPVTGPGAFWLRNPAISGCAEPMRQHMERNTSLPLALSELAILMTARHWSATYAWCRHEPQVLKAGLSAAAVAALRDGRDADFADEPATIVQAVARSLLQTGGLDDATYGRALTAFGLPRLVELISEVGYGCLVSLANTIFEPDSPEGAHDYLPAAAPPRAPVERPARAPRLATSPDADSQAGRIDLIGVTGFAWRQCPKIAEYARGYDETLRLHLSMAPGTCALVVLLVARYWQASSVWPGLARFASASGIDAPTIAAVSCGDRPHTMSDEQALAYDFASELLTAGRPSDATFARAREGLGLTVMTEIPAIVGFLTMIALTANVFVSADGPVA